MYVQEIKYDEQRQQLLVGGASLSTDLDTEQLKQLQHEYNALFELAQAELANQSRVRRALANVRHAVNTGEMPTDILGDLRYLYAAEYFDKAPRPLPNIPRTCTT